MDVYICGAGNISPQNTVDADKFFYESNMVSGESLHCIEPEYKNYIDPKILRRMSRIMKISLVPALIALKESSIKTPEAVITGTGLGCIEDTAVFLKSMVDNNESQLPPTAFIQSTHNTPASQIAIFLKCHSYNTTYSSRWFSFESSLIDAMLQINSGGINNALVGGADELTSDLSEIVNGIYLPGKNSDTGGVRAGLPVGEGAAFFCLSSVKPERSYAKIKFVSTLFEPENYEAVEAHLDSLLLQHNLKRYDIDLVLSGDESRLKDLSMYINYKSLCGEFFTSSAFALWMAAQMIRKNSLPVYFKSDQILTERIKTVLLYNNMDNKYISFILVQHE